MTRTLSKRVYDRLVRDPTASVDGMDARVAAAAPRNATRQVGALALQSAAGWGILAALAGFSLARSLTSIASKDVLGRTIPPGQRGQINGWATVASGVVAVTLGLALRTFGDTQSSTTSLAVLIGIGGLAWLVAAAVYSRVVEQPAPDPVEPGDGALGTAVHLLRDDRRFRHFVAATAFATTVTLAFLGLLQVEGLRAAWWLYPTTYLLLALAHTGTRIGRKTYVAGSRRRQPPDRVRGRLQRGHGRPAAGHGRDQRGVRRHRTRSRPGVPRPARTGRHPCRTPPARNQRRQGGHRMSR